MSSKKIITKIKKFQVIGLNKYRDFDIDFNEPYKILVGENGLGKTTIMDVFYYVLSAKWSMLDRVQFDFIELVIGETIIDFSQSDLRIYVSYLEDDLRMDQPTIDKFLDIEATLEKNIKSPIVYFPVFRNLNQLLLPLLEVSINELIRRRTKINDYLKTYVVENLVFEMQEIEDRLDKFAQTPLIQKFKKLCNKYLQETKFDINDPSNTSVVNINNRELVEIKNLSSGEKQILNFFARTYLSDEDDLIILIDEPEISLSINWQKTLLPDILESGKCSLLFAITHSPFIFKNELDKYAVPMTLYTNATNG